MTQIVLAEHGLACDNVPTIPVNTPPPGRGITPDLQPPSPLRKVPFARMGDHFTIADVTATLFFKSMRQVDAAPDAERFPGLARYVEGRCARPTIAALQ